MNSKILLAVIIILTTVAFNPAITDASNITWTSEEYKAYAGAVDFNGPLPTLIDQETNYGPPFPVSASGSTTFNSGSAVVTESSLYAYAYGPYVEVWSDTGVPIDIKQAWGEASFNGSFTPTMPLLQFSYELSRNNLYEESGIMSVLVYDRTEGVQLYSSPLSAGIGDISIPVTIGNDTWLHMNMFAYTTTPNLDDYSEMTLNYDVNSVVAPEPISSTLFVVGAATLGFRRFRKRVS